MWFGGNGFDKMTPDSRPRLLARLALAAGVALFVVALRYTDWSLITAKGPRLLGASLAAIAISGLWHLARTFAWSRCFPAAERLGFTRLFRVRLAAEAVSYVTVRGVAGEPLKVLLLGGAADARTATAAVALERVAYIVFTTLIVAAGALLAWLTLPLAARWQHVFLGFAVGSVIFTTAIALLIFRRRPPTPPPLPDAARQTTILSRIRRFVAGSMYRAVILLRSDPRRVAVLGVAGAVSYTCMALEVWAVFWIAGLPISLKQALAIETFTRVASFATAAIPANLGALEAASLAAAAAVGTPTGSFLALARRIRGLFWAAAGFAVYPHRTTPAALSRAGDPPTQTMPTLPIFLYVADDPGVAIPSTVRLAGLPIAERVVRAASRAGYAQIAVFARDGALASLQHLDARVAVISQADEWRRWMSAVPGRTVVTAVGPGTLASTALLRSALSIRSIVAGGGPGAASATAVDVPAGTGFPVSGVLRVCATTGRDLHRLSGLLRERLQRDDPRPSGEDVSHGRAQLSLRMRTLADLAGAEQTLRRATYKQTDAKLARFNRRISLPISIALLRTPVTANMMSLFIFALGLLSAWLFSRGEYVAGVLGGVLSLAASILDGCDGEIARLKYQESALGCWLETMGDYSYYLAIFVGLTIGAVRQTGVQAFYPIGAVGLAGTVLSFMVLIYLRRRITEGRPETLHAVAKARFKADPSWWSVIVWRISFVATRAAMPYGIAVLALVNLLPLVVILSAVGSNVYWISLALKLRHLLGTAELGSERPSRRLAPQS
jgi:phosphatidylglycerophosphate synthase